MKISSMRHHLKINKFQYIENDPMQIGRFLLRNSFDFFSNYR